MFNVGINWAKEKSQQRIKGHWKLFRKLWKQYERLCDEVGFVVPTILEWPRSNAYWRETMVKKRLEKNGMVYSDFDGCRYDLRDPSGIQYLKKPWRFAANLPGVKGIFERLCNKDHTHGSTCGKEAKHSQYYTPTMAILIHKVIADFFFSPGSSASGTVADKPLVSDYMQFVSKYGNLDVDPKTLKESDY